MAQLERPTLDGSVRDTYFGWLWAPLSAVDCSPGRRSLFVYLEGPVVFMEKKTCKIKYILSERTGYGKHQNWPCPQILLYLK